MSSGASDGTLVTTPVPDDDGRMMTKNDRHDKTHRGLALAAIMGVRGVGVTTNTEVQWRKKKAIMHGSNTSSRSQGTHFINELA